MAPAARLCVALAAGLAALSGCATRPVPSTPAATESSNPAPPTQPSARQVFVDSALAMLGTPYRYGGAEPGGFDCSGLVDYAARRAGWRLPRTALEQWRAGTPVTREELQPGDLVFMHLSKELHVGIVSAPGQFVHAPSSGGRVRIDRLDATPYAEGFKGGRRISP